jgi:hypothetical protein
VQLQDRRLEPLGPLGVALAQGGDLGPERALGTGGAELGDGQRQHRQANEHGEQGDRHPGAGGAEQRAGGGVEETEQVLGQLDGREHGETPFAR